MPDDHPRLEALRKRHRELDRNISNAERRPASDTTEIQFMKREKLRLKEEMRAFS